MEKITKEELIEMLGGIALSNEELEMVSGGINWNCFANCLIEHGYVHEKLDQAGNKLPIIAECMGKCS